MENSTKAITIGAAIVITLAIITIGFMVLRSGQQSAQTAVSDIGNITNQMKDSEFTKVDGTTISGSEVINTIRSFSGKDISVHVATLRDTSGKDYIKKVDGSNNLQASGTTASFDANSGALDVTKAEYINPNGKFGAAVSRDENGNVTLITFTQK